MLDLHEIQLKAEDKQNLRKLCETRSNQIKYKDALALIHVNKDYLGDQQPLRHDSGFWILQIPRKYNTKDEPLFGGFLQKKQLNATFDVRSQISNASSAFSNVSIDPYILRKAEKIFENQKSKLDIINEEFSLENIGKQLTSNQLKTLDEPRSLTGLDKITISNQQIDQRSSSLKQLQNNQESNTVKIMKNKSIFDNKSRFEERSKIDQDDSYGNYKPIFMTKNRKVTGKIQNNQILHLQRIQSLEKNKPFLGPIQPDLSGEKVSKKKIFPGFSNVATFNPLDQDQTIELDMNGKPKEHFFRKAIDNYQHDCPNQSIVHDPQEIAKIMQNDIQQPLKQQNEIQTKSKISTEYIRDLIDQKNVTQSRLKLLVYLIQNNIDFRTLFQMKIHLIEKYPDDQLIPIEEWKKECQKYMHIFPEETEKKIMEDICIDGQIDKKQLMDLVDTYHYLPIKIKRDKNKSENLYFVMNSNKRGSPNNKEQILSDLKEKNDKMHLSKIMTLIGIKIEEKFRSFAKAFLFFDKNGDQMINKSEFIKGVEGLRVKLPRQDLDKVFDHLDSNSDQFLSYHEFCGISEEKRRNIDPFDSLENQQKLAQNYGLNTESLMALQQNPYMNIQNNQGSENSKFQNSNNGKSWSQNNMSFDDLESQAAMMNIINMGKVNKKRKESVPLSIINNKNFVFGIKSDSMNKGYEKNSTLPNSPNRHYSRQFSNQSHMNFIMSHTDNMKETLQQKINLHLLLQENRIKQQKSILEKIVHTKSSELRSQSVLTKKALDDIDQNLEEMKLNKAFRNDASFFEINNAQQKLSKVYLLPPIQRIQSMNKSIAAHAYDSQVNLESLAKIQKNDNQLKIPILASKKSNEKQSINTIETHQNSLQKNRIPAIIDV